MFKRYIWKLNLGLNVHKLLVLVYIWDIGKQIWCFDKTKPVEHYACYVKEEHSNPHTHQPSSGLAVLRLKPSLAPTFPWHSVMLQKPDHHWLKSSKIWRCSSHHIQSKVRQRLCDIWVHNMQKMSVWEQSYRQLAHLERCISLSVPKESKSWFDHQFLCSVTKNGNMHYWRIYNVHN